jgi:hypothetical protein
MASHALRQTHRTNLCGWSNGPHPPWHILGVNEPFAIRHSLFSTAHCSEVTRRCPEMPLALNHSPFAILTVRRSPLAVSQK